MRQKKLLGIVGGLGPSATIFYYTVAQSLCMETCGHRPRLLIYSLPLEEMCTAARRRDLEAMASLVSEALRALAAAGAEVALVSANTPHLARGIYSRTAEALNLVLVDIVEASVEALRRLGAEKVGLLATTATLRSRLYHSRLEAEGMKPLEPPPETQEALDRAIAEEFTGGSPGAEALSLLAAATRQLLDAGADTILLACTDLSPHRATVEAAAGEAAVVDSAAEQLGAALRLSTG